MELENCYEKKGFIIPIVFSMYTCLNPFKNLDDNNCRLLERWNTQEYGILHVPWIFNKHWEFENSGGMEGW